LLTVEHSQTVGHVCLVQLTLLVIHLAKDDELMPIWQVALQLELLLGSAHDVSLDGYP